MSEYPVLVLGTTSNLQSVTSDLHSCFMDEIEIQAPTEPQRVLMVHALSNEFLIGPGVSFTALASRTAGMVLADFRTLFSEAVIQAQQDVMSYCKELGLLTEMQQPKIGSSNSEEIYDDCHKKSNDLQKDICSAGQLRFFLQIKIASEVFLML